MAERRITIGNHEIIAEEMELNQSELLFYKENPRIYTYLKDLGEDPSQKDIERIMTSQNHVKILKESIKANGGLLEPIIVKQNVVLEGNSRLAAYRILASSDPVMWGKIKCNVLPDDTSEDVIDALLGTLHIIGKTPWSPFEQAGFLVRKIDNSRKPIDAIANELGMKLSDVKKFVEVYRAMLNADDVNPSKWSYYLELLKNSEIKKYDENNPSVHFVDTIKEFIKDDKVVEAKDIRKFATLAKTNNENSKEAIDLVLSGEIDLNEAVELVSTDTKIASLCKKVEVFRTFIGKEQETLKSNISDEHLFFLMKQVYTCLGNIIKNNTNDDNN